jgi:uncharacterized membrane-anchored protein YjiN (DUF445 family)
VFLKLLQERIGKTLEPTGIGNNFLHRTSIAQKLKRKNKKMRVHKTEKETITRLKKHLTEWKKIFVSCTSDKGLITRIYRELKKTKLLNNQQPGEEMAN